MSLELELMIKMSNKKERNNQKEISAKCFLGTTEKCGPFKKIGDHKLYTTKDLIFSTKDHLVMMAQESQRKSELRKDVVFN